MEQLLAVAAVGRCGEEREEQPRWLLFILPFLACWRWKAFVFVAVQAAGRESFRRLSRAVCRDCECARASESHDRRTSRGCTACCTT